MRFLTLEELIELHRRIIEASGGSHGIRDRGALESALAQPRMTFAGQELYPALPDKAAALAFSLILNHAFIDGNKRIGHAAMEVFLFLNGFELCCSVNEQERIILEVAAGRLEREEFTAWVHSHVKALSR